MATPIKAITYLSGIYPRAAPVLPVRPLTLAPRIAVAMRLMPHLWKPIYYRAVQTRGKTVLVPRPLYLQALAAVKMTLFWRDAGGRPKRGQLWPRTR